MSHDVIYFPSEKYFSDRIYVCPMDPSEPSESRFVHRSQIASIGHICGTREMTPALKKRIEANNIFVCEVHFKPDCILTSKLQNVIIFAYIYFALDIYIL